jgi:membrane-bound metal-dependent hydrolase YbcI (DUF457 family)
MLSAGGALLNDFDSHASTASHSLGPVTGLVHRGVRGLSLAAFNLTATGEDRRRTKGTHRGLTHTALAVPAVGAAVWGLTNWLGKPAMLAVLFCVLYLALRGLPPVNRAFVDGVMAAAGTGFAAFALPPSTSSVLVAVAVAVGALSHTLLDATTTAGVPALWPLPLGGQRWRHVGTPRVLRYHTGGGVETAVFAALVVAAVLLIPGVWPLAMDALANIHR